MSANKSVVYDKLKSIVGSANVTNREIILEAYMGTVTISMCGNGHNGIPAA